MVLVSNLTGDTGSPVMLIPEKPNDKLYIYALAGLSGVGLDPVTNRLVRCQPNYTQGFHTPVLYHLSWIKRHTGFDLCMESKAFSLNTDELFDFGLVIIALTTGMVILLSLVSDQKAKFLRLGFSFGSERKKADRTKPGEKSDKKVEVKSIFPVRVKVSLSLDKLISK